MLSNLNSLPSFVYSDFGIIKGFDESTFTVKSQILATICQSDFDVTKSVWQLITGEVQKYIEDKEFISLK